MQIVQPQSLALLVSAALSLNGCIEIDRDSQRSALNQRILLGRGVIEAEAGGTVASNLRRLHEGVELVIPPDALEQDTEISLFVRYGDPRFPSAVQSFEIEPASLRLAVPAILTIEYAREGDVLRLKWYGGEYHTYIRLTDLSADGIRRLSLEQRFALPTVFGLSMVERRKPWWALSSYQRKLALSC